MQARSSLNRSCSPHREQSQRVSDCRAATAITKPRKKTAHPVRTLAMFPSAFSSVRIAASSEYMTNARPPASVTHPVTSDNLHLRLPTRCLIRLDMNLKFLYVQTSEQRPLKQTTCHAYSIAGGQPTGRPDGGWEFPTISVASEDYLLSVTDPEIEEEYLQKGDGTYKLGNAALCISLAEVWNEFAFRVVASIITPERCKV